MARLGFSLLGPVAMTRDGEPVELGSRKRRALLAALLLEANRVVSRERLIDALWGEDPPETAANTLQVHVSQLRKALPDGMLETVVPGYRLRAEPETIDAFEFTRLVEAGRAALASGAPAAAAETLRAALEIWNGAALADVADEPFAGSEVARLEELRLAALEERIAADLALGRHGEVVPELETLIGAHPLRERLRAHLMLALYRAGRQADALAVYHRTRATLVEQLGIEPGVELRELERAILSHDPALELQRRTRRLPVATDRLLGRELELADLAELLRRDETRLVTLVGPGGIGKTRLALELGRRLQAEFADGAAVAFLATASDASAVPRAILGALDLPETGADPEQELVRALGDRRLLLILDNFEQVQTAAPFVSRLLEQVANVKIVVTSRAPLHVRGEHEVAVPPLGVDDAAELFVVRAQAANPALELNEEHADAVAVLCARLDGLPLAIELAAARAKLLPPVALLARLGNRLDLLSSGRRDAPQHQRTLRMTLDWSYDLLDAERRRLFAQLAVFAGGCSLASAEAVCSVDGSVLDGLSTLVDESLVMQRAADEPRFAMLELVREYALERLAASAEREATLRRHLDYFVALAEQAEPELAGARQARWLERLETEHANIRVALAYALEQDDADAALRIVAGVRRFWQIHGYLAEGRESIEAALALDGGPSLLRANALNMAGILAGEQGDYAAARAHFSAAVGEARRAGATRALSSALVNLGNLAFFAGDTAAAHDLYTESIEHFEALGDLRGRAMATENIGLLALARNDLFEARRWLRSARDLAREVGDELEVGRATRSLAAAMVELGDTTEASALLRESFAIASELGDTHGLAVALETSAGLAATTGDYVRAATLFGASDAVRSSIGARRQPDHEIIYERWLSRTLAHLETPAYTKHYEDGRALTLEQACGLASKAQPTAVSLSPSVDG